MKLFKHKEELEAELEESARENQEVKENNSKIEKLRTDLQGHLRDNNFGPRLYAQLVKDWK